MMCQNTLSCSFPFALLHLRPESLHEYLANDRPATVSVYLYAAGAFLFDKLVTSLSP